MPNNRAAGKRRSSIQSIDRATAILKALASGPRRLGVSELAERLGLARPTVHGLLQTLQAHGFADRNPSSAKNHSAPALLHPATQYLNSNDLRPLPTGHPNNPPTRPAPACPV